MAVNIKEIQKKYKELQERKSGGDFNYMDLKQGGNLVRFLSGEDGSFYKEAGYHYIRTGKETKSILCLRLTNGEDCYICDLVKELRGSKDAQDKDLAKQLGARHRIFFNVMDREDGSIKILATGTTIFKRVLEFISDEDWGDITDRKTGHDVTITKTGKDLDTEYSVQPKPKPTAIDANEEDLYDLEAIVIPTTYEEQKATFEGAEAPEAPETSEAPSKPVLAKKEKAVEAPTRKAPKKSALEIKTDQMEELAITDKTVKKALDKWKKADGTEEELDELLDLFGSSSEEAEEAEEAEEEKDDLDKEIDAALEKFKKKGKK